MKPVQALPEAILRSRPYQVLKKSQQEHRLAHGILLYGENMRSLEQVCESLASDLLNTDRPFHHPDCFSCRPRGKARMLTIGQKSDPHDGNRPEGSIRRLVRDLSMTSNQGGNKVGILYEADRMNHSAANAFLKTLEEPPDGTTLFLLTTRPYDLPDTIRSRCLNFQIPSSPEAVTHPDWEQWTIEYRDWLSKLIQGPDRTTVSHIIMVAYGLNLRFQTLLEEMTEEAWKTQKESLSEQVTPEEKNAIQAGIGKGYRKRLFSEIETATDQFARDVESLNKGQFPATALYRATQSLEHCAGLMELNFNPLAALEQFFLTSLRIWTAVR